MSDESRESKCSKCGGKLNSKQSGSITQWVANCACALQETPAEVLNSEICPTCKKRVSSGRAGSLTQWIFRSDLCSCALPTAAQSGMSIAAETAATDTNRVEQSPEVELKVDSERFPTERFAPLVILGSGMAGTVYLCRDRLLRKKVAIKLLTTLTSEQLMAFQGEARAASKLNHPNIVKVMDFGVTTGGVPFMVMESVNGNDLAGILQQEPNISVTAGLYIFEKVGDGLAEAHKQGIFHRDIKNSNILVGGLESHEPEVRLIDFGVASFRPVADSHTLQGATLVGTPAYMSPDQALGKPYDARSEIYSVGCALFEALTGSTPFSADTALEIINKHAHEAAPRLSDINPDVDFSEQLEKVVAKCLEKNPKDRYQSMKELSGALNAASMVEPAGSIATREADKSTVVIASQVTTPPKPVLLLSLAALTIVVVGLVFAIQITRSEQLAQRDSAKISYPRRNPLADKVFSVHGDSYIAEGIVHDGDLEWLADNRADHCKELTLGQMDATTVQSEITSKGWNALKRIKVKNLGLTNCSMHDENLQEIAKIPTLRSINLTRTRVGDKGIAFLENIPITEIMLGGTRVSDNCLNSLKTMKLRKVALNATAITDKGFEQLSKIKTIDWLDLQTTKGTSDGFKYIGQMPDLKFLYITITSQALEGIKNLSKLELRYFSADCDVETFDDQCLIAAAKHWRGLKALLLNNASVTAKGLKHIGEFKDLEILTLSACKLTDDDLIAIVECPKLETIDLMYNPISDKTAKRLATIPTLKNAYLSSTQITQKGADILEKAHIKYQLLSVTGSNTAKDIMENLLNDTSSF